MHKKIYIYISKEKTVEAIMAANEYIEQVRKLYVTIYSELKIGG